MKPFYSVTCIIILIIFFCFNCVQEEGEPPADYSQEYQTIDTSLGQAFDYYNTRLNMEPSTDARNDLVDWLKQQTGIDDASLTPDGCTVKVHFSNGMTPVFLTELRGSDIPSNYADLYDTYSQQHAPLMVPGRRKNNGQLRVNPDQYASVGVSAIILAPFAWESIADPTKVIETEDIAKYFYDFATFDSFINTTILYNENVTIDMIGAALIGFTGPAEILEINTHGGLDTVDGSEIAFFMTGERVTPANLSQHWNDLYTTQTLTWAYVGGKSFYGITPKFVETYSGIPDISNDAWLCRYVHINACFSFHPSLTSTFTGHGAVSYSGYTGKVSWSYGRSSSIEFFKNLATNIPIMSILQAYNNLSVTTDPHFTNTDFQVTGNIDTTYYFYRTFFTFDGISMETPSYLWEVAYNEGTGSSVYWASTALLSPSNVINAQTGGILNIVISAPGADDFNTTTQEHAEIWFTDSTGTVWISKKSEFDAGKPCNGVIHVSEFNDTHGGRIIGSFNGQLVDSDQADPPYTTKNISGDFTVIRNLYEGWSQ